METKNLYRSGVSSPSATLGQMLAGYQVTPLIYVAAKLGIADILADGPKSSAELASIVGAQSRTLRRLLLALACVGDKCGNALRICWSPRFQTRTCKATSGPDFTSPHLRWKRDFLPRA